MRTPSHGAVGATAGNKVSLPQSPGGPAALDGSPYVFYHPPSPTNSTKWTVSINGGGWCYDEVDCLCRSKTRLGTSTGYPDSQGCSCMNTVGDGLDTSLSQVRCLSTPLLSVWPVVISY